MSMKNDFFGDGIFGAGGFDMMDDFMNSMPS